MRQIISKLSSKGQITIPVEVRRHLHLSEGDKLSFVIEDEGGVRLEAPRYRSVASLRGAAGTLKEPVDCDEMLHIAHEDRANRIMTKANSEGPE